MKLIWSGNRTDSRLLSSFPQYTHMSAVFVRLHSHQPCCVSVHSGKGLNSYLILPEQGILFLEEGAQQYTEQCTLGYISRVQLQPCLHSVPLIKYEILQTTTKLFQLSCQTITCQLSSQKLITCFSLLLSRFVTNLTHEKLNCLEKVSQVVLNGSLNRKHTQSSESKKQLNNEFTPYI